MQPSDGDPRTPARRTTHDDEAVADASRRALRASGTIRIEPDERVAVVLGLGERVLALRRQVHVERIGQADGQDASDGDLYLTDRRLVQLGGSEWAVALDAISEAEVGEGRLLLRVGETDGITISVADPRVLRVEIAAARAARR